MLPTGLLLACLPLVYGLSERDVVAHILADYDKDERPHGKNDSLGISAATTLLKLKCLR